MSIITKGLIGEEDIQKYDGTNTTFTRTTSTGGTNTLTPLGAGSSGLKFTKLLASSVVTLSANPAASGFIRLASTDLIVWRNAANNADVILSKNASDNFAWQTGIQAAFFQTQTANPSATQQFRLSSADGIGWRNNANSADIPLGKNTSDQLTFNSQVVPSETAVVDTVQVAAISATTLYTPTATGIFRISAYLKITAVGTSPVLGPVTITYADGTDFVAQSVVMAQQLQTGAMSNTGNSGNTLTSVLTGSLVIYAKVGVPIQYAIAFSGTIGLGQYEAHLKCEAM